MKVFMSQHMDGDREIICRSPFSPLPRGFQELNPDHHGDKLPSPTEPSQRLPDGSVFPHSSGVSEAPVEALGM